MIPTDTIDIVKPSRLEKELSPMTPPPSATASSRVMAIDALRGFDMFWIMGGHGLILALAAAMSSTNETPAWLKTQMAHTHWVGFSCWDLINPLFLFISGASMAFSFDKHLASGQPHRVM